MLHQLSSELARTKRVIVLRLAAAKLPVDRREDTPVERKALAAAPAAVEPASLKQEATADDDHRPPRRSTRNRC